MMLLDIVVFYSLLSLCTCQQNYTISLSTDSVDLSIGDQYLLNVSIDHPSPFDLEFEFTYWDAVGDPIPRSELNRSAINLLNSFIIPAHSADPVSIHIIAKSPGQVTLGLNQTRGPDFISNLLDLSCRISVMRHKWLDILQLIMGWAYFLAWTVSFYPQFFLNCKRKSVVGFNFDFALLNIIGFLIYSIYNGGLYWIPLIRKQYRERHPFGVIPVLLNDLFFSIHALFISTLTGLQIIFYERGNQRVSVFCIVLCVLMALYCLIFAILGALNILIWLDCLYWISNVKLFVSFVKYAPQAVMNCQRRSTIGWSIGNVILDMAGGILSIFQMMLVAYNFNDWSSVTGSPIKFGLGLLSISFDIFFMVQHWCLFRNNTEASVLVNAQMGSTSNRASTTDYSPNLIGLRSDTFSSTDYDVTDGDKNKKRKMG